MLGDSREARQFPGQAQTTTSPSPQKTSQTSKTATGFPHYSCYARPRSADMRGWSERHTAGPGKRQPQRDMWGCVHLDSESVQIGCRLGAGATSLVSKRRRDGWRVGMGTTSVRLTGEGRQGLTQAAPHDRPAISNSDEYRSSSSAYDNKPMLCSSKMGMLHG